MYSSTVIQRITTKCPVPEWTSESDFWDNLDDKIMAHSVTTWHLLISPSRGQPCLKGKRCWNVSKINCFIFTHILVLFFTFTSCTVFMFEHLSEWLTHTFPLQNPVWWKATWLPVCLSMSTSVSSVGAPSSSFSVSRLPQAFSSLGMMWKTHSHTSRQAATLQETTACVWSGDWPAKRGVQAGPEVGMLGEWSKWSGSVATPLVREHCRWEDAVHPHCSLGTNSLFIVKHLVDSRV